MLAPKTRIKLARRKFEGRWAKSIKIIRSDSSSLSKVGNPPADQTSGPRREKSHLSN